VRGRDLLPATSVHRLLQELLGLPAPRYRHHRLVLDPGGCKLSKSRQSLSLAALRESGVSAAQVRAGLGFGGDDGGELSVALS
jgi:glutamyl-Q tRNA(Asp) synthetase